MPTKYKIKDVKLAADPIAKVGDVVYKCSNYDYGLARDDSEWRGFTHVSVTFKEDGGYPFFTIPLRDLEQI